MKAWLYLEKSHLFENPHYHAVMEMVACLQTHLKFLDGNVDKFDLRHLSMVFKVLETPQCEAMPQLC